MDEHETLLGSKVDILPPKERVNEVIDVPNHEHQSIPLVRGALHVGAKAINAGVKLCMIPLVRALILPRTLSLSCQSWLLCALVTAPAQRDPQLKWQW